jgi:diketogulonate reductase-like aldo/keto reductase
MQWRSICGCPIWAKARTAGGEAIRRSGIPRNEIFIETKIWITDYGYAASSMP